MGDFNDILVIKSGALGDLIAGTVAIRALRTAFPRASITVLSNPMMLEVCPPGTLVDDLIVFDPEKASAGAYIRLVRDLRSRKFDLAVNLRWSSEFSAII